MEIQKLFQKEISMFMTDIFFRLLVNELLGMMNPTGKLIRREQRKLVENLKKISRILEINTKMRITLNRNYF